MKTKSMILVGVLIIALAAMAAPVMAADSTTATVAGNAEATIDVSVEGTLTAWTLTPPSVTDSTSVDLVVKANTAGWHVAVVDAMGDGKQVAAGRMQEAVSAAGAYVADAGSMDAALVISAPGGVNGAGAAVGDVTLSGAAANYIVNGASATSTYDGDLTFTQAVSYTGDPVLADNHVYKIVVTFVGTPA